MSKVRQNVIGTTQSVCPHCLNIISAEKIKDGQDIFLRKVCPDHGEFSLILWRGAPLMEDWVRPKIPYENPSPNSVSSKGCPFDCGLCPEHRQQTCTALLEITNRCNLGCPFCFADSGDQTEDPEVSVIRTWYETLRSSGYTCNVQISGGEPTIRDDLDEIISMGRSMGFRFIQLNTNGIRLASDVSYAKDLKESGLSSVFLQFDGLDDEIYLKLRGASLLETKIRAVRNCERCGLGVILVPTLVPGINTDDIGNIIRFALENLSVVRGVHFQPVSYFGRYPEKPADSSRLTLPELMRMIEAQTDGAIKTENFLPPGCENSLCSFHGNFVLMPSGQLIPLTRGGSCGSFREPEKAEVGACKAREFVAKNWGGVAPAYVCANDSQYDMGYWDTLLSRSRTHLLCVSAMAFQDAWSLDLERLRDCCIHVVAGAGKIIPFCAYNLTGSNGKALYRKKAI